MNLESIIDSVKAVEEKPKSFEKLKNVRDFGVVHSSELNSVVESNSNYWRLPTAGEMFSYFEENIKLFSRYFKYKYYWAKDVNAETDFSKHIFVSTSKHGKMWYFSNEAKDAEIGLVMIKKDPQNPEPTKEEYLSPL